MIPDFGRRTGTVIIFLLWLFWCLLLPCLSDSCPASVNEKIQRCVMPVAQYAEALGMGGKSGKRTAKMEPLIPNMGALVFKELCNLIRRFEQCVRSPKRRCPKHLTLSLIDASYGYLCNDGFQIFMKNANCLMELDRETTVRKCHDRTLSVIQSSSEEPGLPMTAKMTRMCQSLNYFAGCVRGPVFQRCGSEAWLVIVRVLRDTTQTLMPTCSFDTSVPAPASDLGVRLTSTATYQHDVSSQSFLGYQNDNLGKEVARWNSKDDNSNRLVNSSSALRPLSFFSLSLVICLFNLYFIRGVHIFDRNIPICH